MINSYSILYILFCYFNIKTVLTAPEAPLITSVEQTSENTVLVKWNVDNNYEITRYRIMFKDMSNLVKEWPTQMEKSDVEFEGTQLSRSRVNSTFECYNLCIRNIECEFAEYLNTDNLYNTENCLLKTKLTETEVESDDLEGREFYMLKKYEKNEAEIKDLPPNNKYSFMVSVYDDLSKQWSSNSSFSIPINIKIEVKIEHSFFDNDNVKINWEQTGKFKNYQLSRYNIKVWTGENESPKDYIIADQIITYDTAYNLYDLAYTSVLRVNIKDGQSCFKECIEENVCIRYLYFYSDKRCYLLAKVNLMHSDLKAKNSELESLYSNAKSFILPFKLEADTNYKVMLEYKTIFGVYGTSNQTIIKLPQPTTVLPTTTLPIPTTTVQLASPSILTDRRNIKAKLGDNELLACKLFDSNSGEIVWTKVKGTTSRSLDEITSESEESDFRTSELTLNELVIEDSGTYKCSFSEDSTVFAQITLTVQGVPAKPVINTLLIKPDGKTYLKWQTDHLGGLKQLRNIFIEYSANFSDPAKELSNIEQYRDSEKSAEIDNSEISLDITIPENDQVRIMLENEIGSSLKSDPVMTKCQDTEQCPGRGAKLEEIKNTEQVNMPKPMNKTTIILIALIALIALIIIMFIVYQNCCRKTAPTSKDEYLAVPRE